VQVPPGNWFAPPGSNRNGSGGNEAVGAFDGKGRLATPRQVKGALVFMLSKYGALHLFPVPPTMSAKMREALYPSGSKG
jgi:hypothetical protein